MLWSELYKGARPGLIDRLHHERPVSDGKAWVLGEARDFVGKLLVPSPSERLTAASARDQEFMGVR